MQFRISFFTLTAVFLLCLSQSVFADGSSRNIDLLAEADQAWADIDASGWRFENGQLIGQTAVFDGAKTDPEASIFLVSKAKLDGDISVSMDITFDVGRYIGVYVNFDQQTQSGIWMATGHALAVEDKKHHVESGYIKTVERGHWIVRTTGELVVEEGRKLHLRFTRLGDDYSLWYNDQLIATYRKPGGYPAGQLQLRLTNAKATISRLVVTTDNSG